jgi:hypothetical protein
MNRLKTWILAAVFAVCAVAAGRAEKDPDARPDYRVDWSSVASSNAIVSSSWTVPAGITKVADSHTDTVALIRLSGGTSGRTYQLLNTVTLTDGQIEVYVLNVEVVRK